MDHFLLHMLSPERHAVTRAFTESKVTHFIAIAVVYVAAAKFGFTMAFRAEQVTLVWPPTGLALASLLLLGDSVWPAVFLGAFLANITSHEPLAVALGIATGNTLEAVGAAWAVRRYAGPTFSRSWLRFTLAVIGCGAVASTMISATIGVTSLCLGGLQPWSAFAPLWRTWWLGDAAGDLILAPAILAISARPRAITWQVGTEIGGLIAGLAAVCAGVFARRFESAALYPFEYIVFPFLIWAAIRFGVAGAALANLLAAAVAIWGTVHGLGPYAAQGPRGDERLMLLQIYLGVIAGSSLLLGATASDRDASRSRKSAWLEAALDCIVTMDHAGRIIEFNPAAERTFGRSRAEAVGRDFAELLLPEHLRDYHRRALTSRHRLGDPGLLGRRFETVALRADGVEFPVEISLSHTGSAGPVTFTAFLRDITEQKHRVRQLTFRATHDGLTNVLNKPAFMEQLTLAARQANVGERGDIAVLFVDLNKFKQINDRHGHVIGDRLLVAIARRLRSAVRPLDSVGRLGGDEFAILVEHVTDHRDVDHVVQRVWDALAQPFNVDGLEIQASASVGISFASKDGPHPQDMLRAADRSMYRAKDAQA